MPPTLAGLLTVLIAYLAGAVPFGLLTAKFAAGIDIRRAGSGNIGATNVARLLGAKLGALVLVLDGLKGLLPVLFAPAIFRGLGGTTDAENHVQVACGVATVMGHMFPCWLGFRGGKGVATSLGVVVVLSWPATLSAAGIFALTFAATRLVALASMLAAVGFAATHLLLQEAPFSAENWSLSAFSLLVPLLIIVRHRSNLQRMLRGEEERFRFGSGAEDGPTNESGAGEAPSNRHETGGVKRHDVTLNRDDGADAEHR